MSDKEYLKRLGKNIRKIRLSKKIKQIDLAYDCDFEGSNMNRIESGKTNPSVKVLRRIAKNLGVSMIDLFDF